MSTFMAGSRECIAATQSTPLRRACDVHGDHVRLEFLVFLRASRRSPLSAMLKSPAALSTDYQAGAEYGWSSATTILIIDL